MLRLATGGSLTSHLSFSTEVRPEMVSVGLWCSLGHSPPGPAHRETGCISVRSKLSCWSNHGPMDLAAVCVCVRVTYPAWTVLVESEM